MSCFTRLMMVMLLFSTHTLFAQDCGTDPNCGDGPISEEIPIDGGALALLAGGAALGYKALKKKKEGNSEK